AIHGHASSPTAGFEAALLGVPTLLLDREGWSVSPLYTLGVGTTMFTNWDDLWVALREHRTRPGGVPNFGDWSSILATLDPFQDGRAAERMGTYLKEILDGLQRGRGRDTVLEEVAERYIAQWGADKVARVHPST
ncbi:MAG: hypothetical protein Q7T01_05185, partial [bacterium]|nr:hypothetical protein [bacterium]